MNELMWWGWNFEKQQWFPCLEKEIRECVTHEGVIVCATTAHRDERKRAVIDAVLAALREAGALLPELPEGWWIAEIVGVFGEYQCIIAHGHPLQMGGPSKRMGTGPTIPAAIANTLEGTDG